MRQQNDDTHYEKSRESERAGISLRIEFPELKMQA